MKNWSTRTGRGHTVQHFRTPARQSYEGKFKQRNTPSTNAVRFWHTNLAMKPSDKPSPTPCQYCVVYSGTNYPFPIGKSNKNPTTIATFLLGLIAFNRASFSSNRWSHPNAP